MVLEITVFNPEFTAFYLLPAETDAWFFDLLHVWRGTILVEVSERHQNRLWLIFQTADFNHY